MDFRSGGPLSGVPAAPVEEDDEQEGERRQRRLEGGHEGLSDIGESTFGTDNSFNIAGFPFQYLSKTVDGWLHVSFLVLLSDGNFALAIYGCGLQPARDISIDKVSSLSVQQNRE